MINFEGPARVGGKNDNGGVHFGPGSRVKIEGKIIPGNAPENPSGKHAEKLAKKLEKLAKIMEEVGEMKPIQENIEHAVSREKWESAPETHTTTDIVSGVLRVNGIAYKMDSITNDGRFVYKKEPFDKQ